MQKQQNPSPGKGQSVPLQPSQDLASGVSFKDAQQLLGTNSVFQAFGLSTKLPLIDNDF